MTWEERARRILRDTGWNLPLYSHQKIERILDAIRPIVEEEIERAHLSTQQAWMTAANLALPAEGQLDRVVEALYASAVEQAVEFKKRAEQAEAHADALIEAGTDLVSRLEPFAVQRRSHESERGGPNALERMKRRLAEAVKWKAEHD